jgi:hypothetical protein
MNDQRVDAVVKDTLLQNAEEGSTVVQHTSQDGSRIIADAASSSPFDDDLAPVAVGCNPFPLPDVVGDVARVDPFLAGFRDCRHEVLRYFQQQQQQQQGKLQQLQQVHCASESTTATDAYAEVPDVASSAPDDVDADSIMLVDDELVDSLRQHLLKAERRLVVDAASCCSSSTPWELVTKATDSSAACASQLDDSALGNSFEASTAAAASDVSFDASDDDVLSDVACERRSAISENAAELMRLACNNPHIGKLLDELFELMDYGSDDDIIGEDEDDVIASDVESDDDGVHELNAEIDDGGSIADEDRLSTSVAEVCTR